MLADHHINFARTVLTAAVEPLQRVRVECKEYASRIATELGKIADEVDTQRQASAKAIESHTKGVNSVGARSRNHLSATDDPFISQCTFVVLVA
jgi:hypothetical protein